MIHTAIVFGDNGHGWARRVETKKKKNINDQDTFLIVLNNFNIHRF